MAYGYQRRQKARAQQGLEHWRQTRLLATLWVNTHRGEHDPAQTPEEFMPLPGDTPPVPLQVMSEEEFDRIAARYS